jgi:hypothetical protein
MIMSRVYFHSPSDEAELHGSERAWLAHLADGPGVAAWNLDGPSAFDRAAELLAMVPEVPDNGYGANYLHTYLRTAQAQEATNKAAYKDWHPGQPLNGPTSHEPQHQLIAALQTSLRVQGLDLEVAGVKLRTANIDLNTALIAGSDPVRLAAKIHGWCESHCWVEGPEREWLAGIIDQGLTAGLYRRGLWYSDTPDGPKDKWSSQGWEDVLTLLRSRDDEPIVLSYSVCDQFPSPYTHPDWPGREVESWNDYTEAEKQAVEDWQERWYENDDHTAKFDAGMLWLRDRRPWARLAPDTLAEVTFGLPVTVYDLFAPDRDERVRAIHRGEATVS